MTATALQGANEMLFSLKARVLHCSMYSGSKLSAEDVMNVSITHFDRLSSLTIELSLKDC